jgi:hypothetical protein
LIKNKRRQLQQTEEKKNEKTMEEMKIIFYLFSITFFSYFPPILSGARMKDTGNLFLTMAEEVNTE